MEDTQGTYEQYLSEQQEVDRKAELDQVLTAQRASIYKEVVERLKMVENMLPLRDSLTRSVIAHLIEYYSTPQKKEEKEI